MRSTLAPFLVILAAALAAAVGCQETACNSDEDCPSGRWCVDERCVTTEPPLSSSGGASTSSSVEEASSWVMPSSSSRTTSSSRRSSSHAALSSTSSATEPSSSSAAATSSSAEPSSSSAAAVSSSVEASSSSTSTASGPETCGNGVDDNGDGKADCADTQCPAWRCLPQVPAGWTGPYEVAEVPEADASPDCEVLFSGTPYDGHSDPAFTAATCACRCGAPEGATCDRPTLHLFSDNGSCNSGGAECATVSFANDDIPCATVDTASCAAAAMKMDLPRVQGGTCTPSADPPALMPWSWQRKARACPVAAELLEGGCGAGGVCSPRAGSPFDAGLCIRHAGVATCPLVNFTQQRVYFADAVDGRECDTCTCGPPQGPCLGTVYTSATVCDPAGPGTRMTQRQLRPTCQTIDQPANFLFAPSTVPSGFCTPRGTPGGAVTGDEATAVTFCCTPS